jgi:hypothetical protein
MADDFEVAGNELEHLGEISIQIAKPAPAIGALAPVRDRRVRMHDRLAWQVCRQDTSAAAAAPRSLLGLSLGRKGLLGLRRSRR